MPRTATATAPGRAAPGTTEHLAQYGSATALVAAALVLLLLTVRLVTVPAALVVLLAQRLATRLDRWLAALPLPPQPVQATATRLPLTGPT